MICTIDEFDYAWFMSLPLQHRKRGNQGTTQQKYYYVDIVTAFDIETTYIEEIDNSVMYIWQWQLEINVLLSAVPGMSSEYLWRN